jgi:hypothetical protein
MTAPTRSCRVDNACMTVGPGAGDFGGSRVKSAGGDTAAIAALEVASDS